MAMVAGVYEKYNFFCTAKGFGKFSSFGKRLLARIALTYSIVVNKYSKLHPNRRPRGNSVSITAIAHKPSFCGIFPVFGS